MRIVSFTADGRAGYGPIREDRICDLSTADSGRYPTLRSALEGGLLQELPGRIAQLHFDLLLADVELLPPVVEPGKIICVGKNYGAHAAEGGHEPPKHPSIFIRLTNTLVPHGANLVRPRLSDQFDFEGELALVIANPGRHIRREDALGHVAGYSIFQDASVRNYQFEHSLAVGKNFVSTGGFGPWLVTADELPDPSALTITTRLNGKQVQHSGTSNLIFDVPEIIAYVSGFTPLAPGDVIATGTPEGVGFARKPPLWMKAGDTIDVEISGIGTLRNHVVDEA